MKGKNESVIGFGYQQHGRKMYQKKNVDAVDTKCIIEDQKPPPQKKNKQIKRKKLLD